MTNDKLKEALRESNKSKTQRMNELKTGLEAHEARQYLAAYTGGEPEDWEEADDDVVLEFARVAQENPPRQNAHIDNELAGAVNANVGSTSRADWEQRKNGDGS